jgi:polyisoprenoid-binding protein YceI
VACIEVFFYFKGGKMKIIAVVALLTLIGGSAAYFYKPQPVAVHEDEKEVRGSENLPEVVRFRLVPAQSTFIVHANRAGLAYFKGHSHRIAAKDFDGEASMSLDSVSPASLTMNIRAASLEETDPVFTAQQKGIINKELNDIVLEPAKYPEITFKSTDIKGSMKNGAFDVKVTGNITLHGVTRPITIPATVTVSGDTFRAKGQFKLNRKKFGVKATEAFHGLVRVRHVLIFEFDIMGQKI